MTTLEEHVDIIAKGIINVADVVMGRVSTLENYDFIKCCNRYNTFQCFYNKREPVAFVKLIDRNRNKQEFEILLQLSSKNPPNSLIYYKTSPDIVNGSVRDSIDSTSTVSDDSGEFKVHYVKMGPQPYVAVIMPWATDCKVVVAENRSDATLRKEVFIGIIDVILNLWEYGLYYLDIKPENFLDYGGKMEGNVYSLGKVVAGDFGSICTREIINKGQIEGNWPVTYNVVSDEGNPNNASYFFIILVFQLLKTWSDLYFPTDIFVYNAMGVLMANTTSLAEKIASGIGISADMPGTKKMKGYETWVILMNELITWVENSKENTTICAAKGKAIGMIRELKGAMVDEVISNIPRRPHNKQREGVKHSPLERRQRREKHKISLKF